LGDKQEAITRENADDATGLSPDELLRLRSMAT